VPTVLPRTPGPRRRPSLRCAPAPRRPGAPAPLADLLDGKAWIAHGYDDAELAPEHGGPARLLVPHLYLWVRGIELLLEDKRGFWENVG